MSTTQTSSYRIWILVSDRGPQVKHLKEFYHWNIVVEDARSGLWKECHASELEPCQKGMYEQFEDVPAIYGRRPLRPRDSDHCVEVARFDPRRMAAIMHVLEATSISNAQPGATCKLYVRKVLKTLTQNQEWYGITSCRNFQDAYAELQEKLGMLKRESSLPSQSERNSRIIKKPERLSESRPSSASTTDSRQSTTSIGTFQRPASVGQEGARKKSIVSMDFLKRKSAP